MEIRSYVPGDETAILDLFKQSFGKEMSLDFWNWRFRQNPFSDQEMISLMWDNDLLVGHYAVSPAEMILDDQPVLTALSMTTMTHPAYGGRGIFTQLANHLYDQIYRQHQVKMVWGFPNLNSHYGFIKNLGWKDIAVVHCMRLDPAAFKVDTSCSFTELKDAGSLPVHRPKNPETRVRMNKTRAYYDWRYFRNPANRYTVLAPAAHSDHFIVFKVFDNNGQKEIDIMEMQHDNSVDAIHALLSAAAVFAGQESSDIVFNYWCPLFQNEHLLLEKLRFMPHLPLTLLGANVFDPGITHPYDFRNWEIAMDYSDVF